MFSLQVLAFAALLAGAAAIVPSRVAAAVPSGCNIPPAYTVTSFMWFNSTHNLDCIEWHPDGDYYTAGCLDSTGNWCDPNDDGCDNCDVPYCNDNVSPQPLGYGPPDNVKFSYSEGTYCESSNSAGSQSWDIGNGIVTCGGSRGFMQFFGDSNPDNSTAKVYVSPPSTKCDNGGLSVDGSSASSQPPSSPSSNSALRPFSSSRPPFLNTTSSYSVSRSAVPSSLITSIPAATTGVGKPGDCYASWDAYWSASHSSSVASVSSLINRPVYSSSPTATITRTATFTSTGYSGRTITFAGETDWTSYEIAGGFTVATVTIPTTVPGETDTITGVPDVLSTGIITETLYTTFRPANISVPPTPTCSLPSVVPQCQSSWESWITTQLAPEPTPPPHCDIFAGFLNNRTVPACVAPFTSAESSYASYINQTSPICRAASIGGTLCQSVRDRYQQDSANSFTPTIGTDFEAFYFSQGTIGGYTTNGLTYIWPTSSTLGAAMSCTLGCGRCAITGGTVQFLYWPTTTPTPSAGNRTATRSKPSENQASITAPPKTVVTLGTTLTSPTVYISYSNVYAANACGTIGTEIGSTILAIPNVSDLSSVYGVTVPCDAHMRPTQLYTLTAPFTVEDLNEPVPYSIYSSQPTCQTYLRSRGCGGTCPTTEPYKPIIVVPDHILQGMQPAWSNCWGDIRGVYDPPQALTAVSEADTPMVATSNTPVQALSAILTSTIVSVVPTAAAQSTAHADDPPAQSSSPANPPSPAKASTVADLPDSDPAKASTSIDLSNLDPSKSTLAAQAGDSTLAAQTGGSTLAAQAGHSTLAVQAGSIADPTQNIATISVATPGAISAAQATTTLSLPSSGSAQVATLGSQTLTVSQGPTSGAVVVNGGVTLSVGDSTTISGQTLSLGSTGLVVVGPTSTVQDSVTTTLKLLGAGSTQVATLGSQTLTVSPGTTSGAVVINGNGATATLTVGGSTTLAGQTLSLGPTGLIVVSQPSSVTPVSPTGPAPTVVGTGTAAVTVSELPGGSSAVLVVGGVSTTVSAGASAVTINGQTVSIGNSGTVVFGGGSSRTTITAPKQLVPGAVPTVVTIGSQAVTIRELSGGSSVILAENGVTTTVSAGSTATVGGQQVSIGSNGIVVFGSGSSTTTITAPTAIASTTTLATSSDPALYKSAATNLIAKTTATVLVPLLLLLAMLI
ncbi:hypothetical protein AMS68_005509 [Peltaster fructicola]|uniref:Uncharacterized protein n=1 Tax=Peltaster fructicola TaxID=286661 RepID=A0A6H0XYZ3_9PEZI|nr:hypothetical protein AMS68_005509 [Peltaster fructicola]